MPSVGLEPTISAGERPQTYALDRAATGTGNTAIYIIVILDISLVFRVTIPDAVFIQFDVLRMSKILLETCTSRGL